MKYFGLRLKAERERLNLSQAEFALKCGVGKTAQYMYEKSEREPSWSYMEKADALGADTDYIISGVRRSNDWGYAKAYIRMLSTIEMLLGLQENRFKDISEIVFDENNKLEETGNANFDPYNRAVMEWLQTSTKPHRCLDIDLLTRVLIHIEAFAVNSGIQLETAKKVKAALMLYREFKNGKKIDQNLIEETISLAS